MKGNISRDGCCLSVPPIWEFSAYRKALIGDGCPANGHQGRPENRDWIHAGDLVSYQFAPLGEFLQVRYRQVNNGYPAGWSSALLAYRQS